MVEEPPPVQWPQVGELTSRASATSAKRAQSELDLPPYPTTTTGSLPQTPRSATCASASARKSSARSDYEAEMASLITDSVGWQERMGLDVLVHGEFERTDMVEYFAEQMDGFLTTATAGCSRTGADASAPRSSPRRPPSVSR